jgi:predicted transport protein
MSDIKLFQIQGQKVTELTGSAAKIEKSLQNQIEANLETYLGVRFLASEYSTGTNHGGRIDTLGIDENGSPVIIEYKRSMNENVINQGLFYLDWLLDHKAEFELLILKNMSKGDSENNIDWYNPRLLCIAGDFTKYDEHAVKQMNRNIELIRYRRFGDDLLLLELVNVAEAKGNGNNGSQVISGRAKTKQEYKTVSEHLKSANQELTDLYHALRDFMMNLGDDVQEKTLKYYFAYKRIKNFACVEVYTQSNKLQVYVKLNPDDIKLEEGFTRDVRNIGHFGTGDLEITIRNEEDLTKAESLILRSYEGS